MLARLLCVSLAVVLFAFLGIARPAASEAYVPEPVVQQNIPTIAEHAARGGAVSIPGVDCTGRCADWWVQEHRPIAGQPSSERLHRELRTLRSRALGVLPKLRAFGTVSLVPGTLELGWRIGSDINAKLLKIGLPEKQPAGGADGEWSRMVWMSAEDYVMLHGVRPREAGWTLWYDSPTTGPSREVWYDPPCRHAGLAPPQPFVPVGPENAPGPPGCLDTEGWWIPLPGSRAYYAFAPEDALRAPAPIEDYTGQPYWRQTPAWPDQPADRTQLETRTRTALESGEHTRAEAWWAELLDPRNQDTATDEDEDCALGEGGTGVDSGFERGSGNTGEEFLRRYEQVPADAYPTPGLPSINGTVYLRWGVTTPNLDNTHIEWRGWGYRKIKAKHGWGSDDMEATRVALLDTTPTPHPTIPGRYRYIGPEYGGRNGTRCKRVVVVEHERNQEEIEKNAPASAGVISSFGSRVG